MILQKYLLLSVQSIEQLPKEMMVSPGHVAHENMAMNTPETDHRK